MKKPLIRELPFKDAIATMKKDPEAADIAFRQYYDDRAANRTTPIFDPKYVEKHALQVYRDYGFPEPTEGVVAARSPAHAAQIIHKFYKNKNKLTGNAKNPVSRAKQLDKIETDLPYLRGAQDYIGTSHENTFHQYANEMCAGLPGLVWVRHYDYGLRIKGVEAQYKGPDYRSIFELFRNVSAAWFYDRVCIVVEPPINTLQQDDEGRIHSVTGPVFQWRDGYGTYYFRGVQVPGKWVYDTANMDPSIALTWRNVEQRNAAALLIGWDKVLDKLPNVRTLDTDPDPEFGILIEADLPDAPREQFLRAKCGTGRDVVIPLMGRRFKTAREANAATYGFSAEHWNPEIRT